MATETISIDMEAYQRLGAARRNPRDSFSQVIRLAQWPQEARTCGGLLAALPTLAASEEPTDRSQRSLDCRLCSGSGLPLVSNNSTHFNRISGLSVVGYRRAGLACWFSYPVLPHKLLASLPWSRQVRRF